MVILNSFVISILRVGGKKSKRYSSRFDALLDQITFLIFAIGMVIEKINAIKAFHR